MDLISLHLRISRPEAPCFLTDKEALATFFLTLSQGACPRKKIFASFFLSFIQTCAPCLLSGKVFARIFLL